MKIEKLSKLTNIKVNNTAKKFWTVYLNIFQRATYKWMLHTWRNAPLITTREMQHQNHKGVVTTIKRQHSEFWWGRGQRGTWVDCSHCGKYYGSSSRSQKQSYHVIQPSHPWVDTKRNDISLLKNILSATLPTRAKKWKNSNVHEPMGG